MVDFYFCKLVFFLNNSQGDNHLILKFRELIHTQQQISGILLWHECCRMRKTNVTLLTLLKTLGTLNLFIEYRLYAKTEC